MPKYGPNQNHGWIDWFLIMIAVESMSIYDSRIWFLFYDRYLNALHSFGCDTYQLQVVADPGSTE